MSRTAKLFITISLLLNVILISAAGVTFYKKAQVQSDSPQISKEARLKLKNAVDIDKRKMFNNVRSLKEKSNALKSIMEAEQFDKEAYDSAMNELLDMRDQMARERARKMGEAMSSLSVEERKQLSKSLVRSLSKAQQKRPNRFRERQTP